MTADRQRAAPAARWVLLALFAVQFLTSFRPQELAWDGAFYYATARSILFDGDLRIGNDLILSYDATPDANFAAQHFEDVLTPTGRTDSPFAIGTSLLWLPWLALIYGIMRELGSLGLVPLPLTGFEWPFVWGIATVTCLYGWTAIRVACRWARQFASEWAVLVAGAALMFTTPLWYYQFREPFYAHAPSALLTALFVSAWYRSTATPQQPIPAFLLGLLGGLNGLVRWQNLAYLVLPVSTALVTAWTALANRDPQALGRIFLSALLTGTGALLAFSPQLATWHVLYGHPLTVPQGTGFVDWRAPWIGQVLLSPFKGLLPWMPVAVPALIGLFLLARRFPRRAIPLLLSLALQVAINGSVQQWFGGGGYGPRRFSSTLVIILVGYACLVGAREERWYRALAVVLSSALVLHQLLILRYGFADQIGGTIVSSGPSYDWAWQADNYAAFARQWVSYVPRAVRHPLQTLVQPGSPLDASAPPRLALARLALLLPGLASVLYALCLGGRRLARRWATSRRVQRLLVALTVPLIALTDIYLVACA